ncbi:unnamed protein product [Clavelina lepadiformis]|uniref:tRNA (adenine(58)-N(1))-methyltransferase non-catalytic subunit TRM6 n=1 Tax=Clavelina lepadiformis TaxID=159417 RepID=A0ABP0H2V6_CLALP
MEDGIALNKTVILQRNNVLKAVKLIPEKVIVFERMRFKPENAVGLPFGSVFEVKNGDLNPVNSSLSLEEMETAGEDNRNLVDTHGKSQTLNREDLIQMKEDGATGKEIVQSLVENSSSFAGKTVFSQKKYLKKKQKKHLAYLQLLKPTSRLICKLYQEREPAKICHMRIDSMSQLLTSTNVRHGSKVAVFETCSGLLLGMVLERLAGKGSIVNLHPGETPVNLFAVSHFNFPDEYWDNLHSLPLHKLAPLLAGNSFQSTFDESNKTTCESEVPLESNDSSTDIANENNSKHEIAIPVDIKAVENLNEKACNGPLKRKLSLSDKEKTAIRVERQKKRFNHQKAAWELLESRNMDALIVASRFHPTPIVLSLLEVLAVSKPFAIYFEYKEALMELFVRLSVSGAAINLQLTDTFMRQYQVLPERTHPHVMMRGHGGYLLTGIKVRPFSAQQEK